MSNDKIKFSFILPCYNGKDSIEECLQSICAQSYESIEIIVIDDGSTDLSLEVCKKFAQKDNRIRLFQQENRGVSSARNLGLQYAKGEFIIFVDVDDYIAANFCEIAYYYIHEPRTASSDFWIFNHEEVESTMDRVCLQHEHSDVYKLCKSTDCFIWGQKEQLELQYMTLDSRRIWDVDCSFSAVWSKVFRKKYLEKNSILFNRKVTRGEDTLFLLHCLLTMQQISYIPIKLYQYKRSIDSVSNSFIENRVEEDQIFLQEFYTLLDTYNCLKKLKTLYYYATINGFKYCLDEHILQKSNNKSIKERKETIKVLLNTEPYREAFSNFREIDKKHFRTYSYYMSLFCKIHQFWLVFLLHELKQQKQRFITKKLRVVHNESSNQCNNTSI